MTRYPGQDEAGRPIVAELGRAETPQETADRKAAASAARRGHQTSFNLFIAVVASLAIVAFLVMVVVRPDQGSLRDPIDFASVASEAQPAVDETLIVPELPDDWTANRAELVTGSDGVLAWQIGLLTPEQRYLAIAQGVDANPSWLDSQVRGAKAGEVVTIGGIPWTSYDRREVTDPGNVAYALVTEAGASTIVISGTATDGDFTVLAEAVAQELTE